MRKFKVSLTVTTYDDVTHEVYLDEHSLLLATEHKDIAEKLHSVVDSIATELVPDNCKEEDAESKIQYVHDMGAKCPSCGGLQIVSAGNLHFESDYIMHAVQCETCDHLWEDMFVLAGYFDLDPAKLAEKKGALVTSGPEAPVANQPAVEEQDLSFSFA